MTDYQAKMENSFKKFGMVIVKHDRSTPQCFQTLGDPSSEDHKEYSRYVNDNLQAWKNVNFPASNLEFPSILTKFPFSPGPPVWHISLLYIFL